MIQNREPIISTFEGGKTIVLLNNWKTNDFKVNSTADSC